MVPEAVACEARAARETPVTHGQPALKRHSAPSVAASRDAGEITDEAGMGAGQGAQG